MDFAKNFLLAFLGFFALACVIMGVAIGPILAAMHFGIRPLPYGLPTILAIWCAIAALISAAGMTGAKP